MAEKSRNTIEYIKMIRESPEKKRSYTFFAFSLFVSILLIVFAIRPTILTVLEINKELKEKKRINTQLKSKIDALSNLDKQYIEYKEDFENLELIYPTGEGHILFISNIDSVLARNGFTLGSMSFQKYRGTASKSTSSVLLPGIIRLSVKGLDRNIISLLKDLEALPTYPVIETFSYSNQKDEDGKSSYSIGLRVYTVINDKFYK